MSASDNHAATDPLAFLAELGLSPDAKLADVRQQIARLCAADLLREVVMGLPAVEYDLLELPPDSWSPKHLPPGDEAVEAALEEAVYAKTAGATPEALERAVQFEIWQLVPRLRRIVGLTGTWRRAAAQAMTAEETAA